MIKSAHCTITILMKNAVWHVNSTIFLCSYVWRNNGNIRWVWNLDIQISAETWKTPDVSTHPLLAIAIFEVIHMLVIPKHAYPQQRGWQEPILSQNDKVGKKASKGLKHAWSRNRTTAQSMDWPSSAYYVFCRFKIHIEHNYTATSGIIFWNQYYPNQHVLAEERNSVTGIPDE